MCLRCDALTLLEVERQIGGDDGVLQDLDHRLVDVGVDVTQDVVALISHQHNRAFNETNRF